MSFIGDIPLYHNGDTVYTNEISELDQEHRELKNQGYDNDAPCICDISEEGHVKDEPWEHDEGAILEFVRDYLRNTYSQHYAPTGQNRIDHHIQPVDLMAASGVISDYASANIIKYASRYGKKDGKNIKDLLKIIHYAMLLMYYDNHDYT